MEAPIAELTLRIEPGSEPISGQISRPDGSEAPFEGYVQLIAALERLRGGAVSVSEQPACGD